jgi:predicted MFS family arabinose efflux permease
MVLLFAALQFCHILDFVLMMPLGPRLMADLNISAKEFGLLVSSYSIAAAFSGLGVALLIDLFERRRALFFLFAGFIGATFACGLSPSYYWLLLARIIAGCFGGVVGACVFAIMGDVIAPHRRGRAMGLVMSSFSIASVAGVPAGLALAEHWQWNTPFFVLSACSTLVAALIFLVLPKLDGHLSPVTEATTGAPLGPENAQHRLTLFTRVLHELKETALNRPHLLSFAMISFLMMSGFFIIPFIATFLVHNAGLSASDLPMVYFFGGLGTILSAQIIGRCADHFGHLKTLFAATAMSIVPVTLLVQEWAHERLAVFGLMTLFMMFVSGRMVPAMALITAASDPKRRGTFMSLFTSVQAGSMGLAALVGGRVVTEASDGRLLGFPKLGLLYLATSVAMVFAARAVHRQTGYGRG